MAAAASSAITAAWRCTAWTILIQEKKNDFDKLLA